MPYFRHMAAVLAGLLAIGAPVQKAFCQAPDPQTQKLKDRLELIGNFADKYCKEVPLDVRNRGVELSAQGKADLAELLKKLADVGVNAAAKYIDAQSFNVLQKDLAGTISRNLDCRNSLWQDLGKQLPLPEPAPVPVKKVSTQLYFAKPSGQAMTNPTNGMKIPILTISEVARGSAEVSRFLCLRLG
ncbi:MAG TPA: hypothetical protein VN325_07920 [Steroidobacteraceae bacterium]|nr:hypothetical protein [Steroidobacteraceae bacterium]